MAQVFAVSARQGLHAVRMVMGDKSPRDARGFVKLFPEAMYHRCTVHLYRNALSKMPACKRKRVAAKLEAIHAQVSLDAGLRKAEEVVRELETGILADTARTLREGVAETLTYARFPIERWRRIRTNIGIERLNRELKYRMKAVGSFPDGRSAMMLAAVR